MSSAAPGSGSEGLYQKLTGISPIIGTEICHLASIDGDRSANELSPAELTHLYHMFDLLMEDVKTAGLRRTSSTAVRSRWNFLPYR